MPPPPFASEEVDVKRKFGSALKPFATKKNTEERKREEGRGGASKIILYNYFSYLELGREEKRRETLIPFSLVGFISDQGPEIFFFSE